MPDARKQYEDAGVLIAPGGSDLVGHCEIDEGGLCGPLAQSSRALLVLDFC